MAHAFPLFTVAQINPVVGDVDANTRKILSLHQDAVRRRSRLLITPESGVTGLPLENLVNHPDLLEAVSMALDVLAAATKDTGTALMIGAPLGDGDGVYDSVLVVDDGRLIHAAKKKHSPGHTVFDRRRGFRPYPAPVKPFVLDNLKIGLMICEDLWRTEVAAELAANGAEFLVAVSASPFSENIFAARLNQAAESRVAETGLPILYVNAVGGQDEAVFDGGSFLLNANGRRVHQLPLWEEAVADFRLDDPQNDAAANDFADPMKCIWRALMLGIRDYAEKAGFTDVMVGLTNGIDSAVAAALAGDALGPGRVHCALLPSEPAAGFPEDAARAMCSAWGFSLASLPVDGVVDAARAVVENESPGVPLSAAALEDMRSRARGYLLMSMANDRGWLLLSPVNKSALDVGGASPHGDMCGRYNPLKDVYESMAYLLANWRNQQRPEGLLGPGGEAIPEEIVSGPQAPEIVPDRADPDPLPPYPILDSILSEMTENQAPTSHIAELGFGGEMVKRIYDLYLRSEYKRRQDAPGPYAARQAGPLDRRIPTINRFDPDQFETLAKLPAAADLVYLKALRWKNAGS